MNTHGIVTRRNFVQTSAAIGAAPFLLSKGGAYADTQDEVLKVGLVGCGGRGTGAASQAMNADYGARLVALADLTPERLDRTRRNLSDPAQVGEENAKKMQVTDETAFLGFDAYKKVIDMVDVVLLATTPVFRPEHLKYAIENNKHVFCEKPVAVDAPGIRSVLETAAEAKRRGLSLMSGFCWRYSYPQRELYHRIHDGRIGDVVAMHTTYNSNPLTYVPREPGWSDMEWQLRNWQAFIWSSGDHIIEQSIHGIDWINWAHQGVTPTAAFANGGRIARDLFEWSGNIYDHFTTFYEYEDGSRAFHMCRQIQDCWNDNTAYIIGTKGKAYSNPRQPESIRIEGENPWQWGGGDNPNMYQVEHDELFAAIRAGRPINDGLWMCQSTMMGILGREAAYSGQRLTWNEVMNSRRSLTPAEYRWGDHELEPVPVPGKYKFT